MILLVEVHIVQSKITKIRTARANKKLFKEFKNDSGTFL